jgi:hypothetical protein
MLGIGHRKIRGQWADDRRQTLKAAKARVLEVNEKKFLIEKAKGSAEK